MMSPLIDIRSLAVWAGGRRVLALPELSVGEGEMLGVLGPNGAGKSTLLRVCVGMQRYQGGQVAVLGRELGELGGGDLARLRRSIGYVPQALAMYSEMPLTVREVVLIGRTGIRGLGRRLTKADLEAAEGWIERLGLGGAGGAAFADLSGGQQRRALLARAMVQEPRVLLLDEPTAHLDLGGREEIVGVLTQLHVSTGVTVLLVCHDLQVLPPACDRVLVLSGGEVAAIGEPRSVLTDERVSSLYGVAMAVSVEAGRFTVRARGERGVSIGS